jgi:hypothetical protein
MKNKRKEWHTATKPSFLEVFVFSMFTVAAKSFNKTIVFHAAHKSPDNFFSESNRE